MNFHLNLHRCFYALPLPSALNRTVTDLIAELRRHDDGAVRWTPPQNLHLTLRFLGELEDTPFNDAALFLSSASFGKRFRIGIEGIDAFPSLSKPSVLILSAAGGSREDHQALLALQQRTEEFARQLGLEPENRPFRSHITLGRVKRSLSPALRTALHNAQEELKGQNFGEPAGEIESLLFMESVLKPEGATYRVVGKAVLE